MPDGAPSELLIEDVGAVRVLTMHRPAKLNALNFTLTRSLHEAFRAIDLDVDVRCVVLTGAGRAFCAGADTSEFASLTGDNTAAVRERAQLTTDLHASIPTLRVPVIAAVNGVAMGGGAGLALACDIGIAASNAAFGYPEVKHGIVPAIVMASLVRSVGAKRAFELAATGRKVSAAEALQLGMINAVTAEGAAVDTAMTMARTIADCEPRSIEATKALLHRVADLPFAEGLALGKVANARMRGVDA